MNSGRVFYKVNELLIFNSGVEKVYLEAYDSVKNEDLKAFFNERAFERNQFTKDLKAEMESIEEKSQQSAGLSTNFYEIWRNFRNLVLMDNENGLLNEVYRLKEVSIEMYNQLLMEPNLPLSVCKLLGKQRDSIQAAMNMMKRDLTLVY
ncbi:DUF2383 domain-containing protein [Aestuariibaculum suncheonense]|uniref:DUF2383 domain-containing protein n=1 Tax=Aestuariibaculum suncheonense TaxID=1028745 RepID=A0A8J6QA20_9FLAO|nr:DUF2383 domain-containing protein [Aestuariibaculum suncheonense]MBD0834123.1 DUF2383 domain-containing protein [Aestuariibaculum suncheonense]